MTIKKAVPLLRVTDVARSMAWYRDILGFIGDPFPSKQPYKFAILRHGPVEIMLRLSQMPFQPKARQYDWDLYLRLETKNFRELFSVLSAKGIVTRRLERMFYDLAEFEITDPDGHNICLSQPLNDISDLPMPEF